MSSNISSSLCPWMCPLTIRKFLLVLLVLKSEELLLIIMVLVFRKLMFSVSFVFSIISSDQFRRSNQLYKKTDETPIILK